MPPSARRMRDSRAEMNGLFMMEQYSHTDPGRPSGQRCYTPRCLAVETRNFHQQMTEPRHHPRKISAGVILVDPDGRVLLQLRDDDPAIMFPGHWGITGGAGHAGESAEQTARGEVSEETRLAVG